MTDQRALIKAAQRAGLRFVHRGKHPRIVNPATGRGVSISGTPGDINACRQAQRDIKKYLGVVLS